MKELKTYTGSCDASGVVFLDNEYFASGTDEANRVSIHSLSGKSGPATFLDIDVFLGATFNEKKKIFAECDVESATRLGVITLWITSHGRDKRGESKPDRHRLFALKVAGVGHEIHLLPHGRPYRNLLEDLLSADYPNDWRLTEAATKAPQQEAGLNIEAVCATPEGSVWIGFRNPIPQSHAILVELLNPLELIELPDTQAKFGRFLSLNLGGRGIRDMVYSDGRYLILAGAFDDTRQFALFEWSGEDSLPVALSLDPSDGGLNPEGLLIFPNDTETLHIFSDDDSVMVDGVENKELPQAERTFRVVSLNCSSAQV